MTIGIEAERANLDQKTGVEVYAAQLIKHLALIDKTNQYILYFRTRPQDWFYKLPPNFKLKVVPFPKFWTQIRISWEMLMYPVDVLVILASALPFIHPKKSIITVHDIAFELFSNIYSGFLTLYQKFFARFATAHAAKIIAVSRASKKDLIRVYGTAAEKIVVIHLAFDASSNKPMNYSEVQPVLDKYNLTYKKYILFVGTLQPRKNIVRLIEAFIKLKKENRIEEKLVIAGGKGWLFEPIMERIAAADVADSVKFLGFVGEQDKAALYNGSVLTTLPALYEGFGLPPLEAMACRVPVVVSNVSSLPEVVGDAGILVNPNSVDSIAEGLLKVLVDKKLQEDLAQKGYERSKMFSWEKTARETLALIESLK